MAASVSADELENDLKSGSVLVVDVRRQVDYEADPGRIPGAERRDPAAVEGWAAELATGRPVVVYCVKGGQVSQSVADALSRAGARAAFLQGGIKAWTESGRTTG